MKYVLLFVICFSTAAPCFSQDTFANAVQALEKELYFQLASESHEVLNHPKPAFIKRFKRCSEHKTLEKLAALNFGSITKVKYADLVKKGNFRITLQEWEFTTADLTKAFTQTLDAIGRRHIQDCVNKGGFMWWSIGSKLYLLTSPAYNMTFEYKDIKKVLNAELDK